MKSLTVHQLGKQYWIPKPLAASTPSRLARLRAALSAPFSGETLAGRELWALKDVSFDVERGQVLGVIGANGAGKTTLLKIIARVIAPSAGYVRGRGRVVSLLELGAGFDDELSARDNIYLNAALNGIPRAIVERRFDDIIAFAELQEFVDTALKFYSSGMYLRLAFSVAVNMEPAVLLADEILAVGDLAFQERCLQKVRELARDSGLTVLFVSHDMEAVSRICDRVIWLKGGMLHRDGQAEDVVTEYQNATWEMLTAGETTAAPGSSHAGRYGEIMEVKLLSTDGREIGSPPRNEDVYVRIRFRTLRAKSHARCAFDLFTKGVLVLRSAHPALVPVGPDTVYEAVARIPANLLSETMYTINVCVTLVRGEGEEHALLVNKALAFMVYGDDGVANPNETLHRKGVIDPQLQWTVEAESHAVHA